MCMYINNRYGDDIHIHGKGGTRKQKKRTVVVGCGLLFNRTDFLLVCLFF